MNRRQRKKLHKKFLDYIQDLCHVGDSTKRRYWRQRLMNADFFEPLRIDKDTLGSTAETGLGDFTTQALRRYNLVYQATKLPVSHGSWADWATEENCVVFRFQSVEFPGIVTDTYNNTET